MVQVSLKACPDEPNGASLLFVTFLFDVTQHLIEVGSVNRIDPTHGDLSHGRIIIVGCGFTSLQHFRTEPNLD